MDETVYKTELNEIITKYKGKIYTINDNYNHLNGFFEEIKSLFKKVNGTYTFTDFFIKSAIYLLLNYKVSYSSPKQEEDRFKSLFSSCIGENRLLNLSSYNSYNDTISITNDDGSITNIFIKFTPNYIQYHFDNFDMLIYDIINNIIFEKLLSIEENKIYRKYINIYKGSLSSYSYHFYGERNVEKLIWNYNHLNYEHEYSPYNYHNLKNPEKCLYKYDLLLCMFEEIKKPISLKMIFRNYHHNYSRQRAETEIYKTRLKNVVYKYADLYYFIKYFGCNYGFIHGDLHEENILYEEDNDRLVLIDFGRSVFCKYIDTYDERLNECLMSEYKKLNYDVGFKDYRITHRNYIELFRDERFNGKISIVKNTSGIYFGVIFELITFSIKAYRNIIYFMYKIHNDLYEEFIKNFKLILNLEAIKDKTDIPIILFTPNIKIYFTDTIEKLVFNYNNVKNNYIDKLEDLDLKKLLTFLSEGLFYTSLFILFTGDDTLNFGDTSNKYINNAYKFNEYNSNEFKSFIDENLKKHKHLFINDILISNFISGGKIKRIKKIKSYK